MIIVVSKVWWWGGCIAPASLRFGELKHPRLSNELELAMIYLNIPGNKPVKPTQPTVRPTVYSVKNGVVEVK